MSLRGTSPWWIGSSLISPTSRLITWFVSISSSLSLFKILAKHDLWEFYLLHLFQVDGLTKAQEEGYTYKHYFGSSNHQAYADDYQ